MKKLITNLIDAAQGKAPLGAQRSSHWVTVRKHHLENNPKCAVCEGTEVLEVHHIEPFHLNPALELDPNNLITLCESKRFGITCHLLVGHLGSYKEVNPDVKADAALFNAKLKTSVLK